MEEGRIYPTFTEVMEPFFRADGKPRKEMLMNREESFHHTGKYVLSDNPIIKQYQLDRTQGHLERLFQICKDQHIFFVRPKKKKQSAVYGFTSKMDLIMNNLNRLQVRTEKAQIREDEVRGMTPVPTMSKAS